METFPFAIDIRPVTETNVFVLMRCVKMTWSVLGNFRLLHNVWNVEPMISVRISRFVMMMVSVSVGISFVQVQIWSVLLKMV